MPAEVAMPRLDMPRLLTPWLFIRLLLSMAMFIVEFVIVKPANDIQLFMMGAAWLVVTMSIFAPLRNQISQLANENWCGDGERLLKKGPANHMRRGEGA